MPRSLCGVVSQPQLSMSGVTMQSAVYDSVHGTKHCRLSAVLHDMCDWGIMHWSVAQSLTDALVDDNADYNQWTHPDVRAIARLGNCGKNSGHVRRDAIKRFPIAEGTPEPLNVKIHVIRTTVNNCTMDSTMWQS